METTPYTLPFRNYLSSDSFPEPPFMPSSMSFGESLAWSGVNLCSFRYNELDTQSKRDYDRIMKGGIR